MRMPHALVASVCSKYTQSLASRDLSSAELSSLVWMFATVEYCPDSVSHTLCALVRDRLHTFNTVELMNLRWSFACLGKRLSPPLQDLSPAAKGEHWQPVRARGFGLL